ncbi:hypothetical protein QBC34DRAFT_158769 [Podospora aff. communis PSN243]|uniref:rRNA-processing protein FYV7 n=1 Tax=Podospora aff. communis PSN243 TaxID=3040156 RepID=A0AAV9H358_9PEZI|nr:hypothetical protein QBC34DRAFT_158769 [Podospora aff. communis PSN243]
MAPKRPHDDVPGDRDDRKKKPRTGFRVGPANLPDGAWKRKVTKIKKNLIVKAKVKKQYAKLKAERALQNPAPSLPIPADELDPTIPKPSTSHDDPKDSEDDDDKPTDPTPPAIHPARQAMLDAPSQPEPEPEKHQPRERRERKPRPQKPDYFAKQIAAAEAAKAEAEARAAEIARRKAEREKAIADRELYRKRMAKAKTPGRDGKRKLGRESGLLLDKVKRIVGET